MNIRYLMIDRIVKSKDGYYIYIFGNNNMSEKLRKRKNNEYLLLLQTFANQSGNKIKVVKYLPQSQKFIINKEILPFSQYQKIFCKENNSANIISRSKRLGDAKESNDDKYVTKLLETLTGDHTFIGDDEGVKITEKLLGNNSTRGFDIDILDNKRKIAFEFLRRKNKYINNLTAHPMRYAWNSQNRDNRQKFISLWNFCKANALTFILVSYSMKEFDSSVYKIIIPNNIDNELGFTKDYEYYLKKDDFLDFMKSEKTPIDYLKYHSISKITLDHSDFSTGSYKNKLNKWAKNFIS